jgi:dTDP-4-amino-4,6-dideoxygalactose transaminase
MNIPQQRLDRGYEKYREEYEAKAIEVLQSGWYVLGKQVEAFENEFAAYANARYCRGLASGLDALQIAFRALKIGPEDEVLGKYIYRKHYGNYHERCNTSIY